MNMINSLENNLYHHVRECGETCGINGKSSTHTGSHSNSHLIGEVDPLGNVKYNLRSDNKRSIKIPLRYAEKAIKLLNFALESKDYRELEVRMHEDPFTSKVYIPEKITNIIGKGKKIGSHESRKLIDEIYILTCLNMCYDELAVNEGAERLNTIRNTEFLNKTLESL